MSDPRQPLLIELCTKMLECPGCPWALVKSQTVLPEGPCDAQVVIVGRNPGGQEDKYGQPFYPDAPGGRDLNKFLAAIRLPREHVWVTNTAKCQGGKGDPPPTQAVYANCKHWVFEEIEIIRPKLLVVLGNDALKEILDIEGSSARLQGTVIPYPKDPTIKAMILSHPGWWCRQGDYVEKTLIPEVAPKFRAVCEKLGIRTEAPCSPRPTSPSSCTNE